MALERGCMLNSKTIFAELCQVTPGGVNSPFRSFKHVGGTPPVIERGQGCYIYDVEGKRYIDLCCAWGPVILGHNNPAIAEAVVLALQAGPVFGAPMTGELEFARLLQSAMPSLEQVRFVNSGAEAVASCLRVARGATRKARIMKFEGGYHGHVECLDAAGSEARDLGGALALGASPGAVSETLVAEYNSLESVSELFRSYPGEIAAVILEPITGSMGVICADPAFLAGLQKICRENASLLIFDEVLSGFRVGRGGAQELLNLKPDLTCLGKALAGGLPIGAYGGRRELMAQLAPQGTIYQAGTFCGNPISMRAGIACLNQLNGEVYQHLRHLTEHLALGLEAIAPELIVQWVPGMLSLHVGNRLHSHRDLASLDTQRFSLLHRILLEDGIYLPPSCIDAACLTTSHTEEVLDEVIAAVKRAWQKTAS